MSLGLRYLSPLTNTSRREALLIILMSPVITWPAWGTCTRIFSEKIKTFFKFLTRFCSIPINVIVSNVLTFFSSARGHTPTNLFPMFLNFKDLTYLALSVPDQGYSRNASCSLNLISMFLLLSLCPYLCWWTISLRGYHPPSSQCIDTETVY